MPRPLKVVLELMEHDSCIINGIDHLSGRDIAPKDSLILWSPVELADILHLILWENMDLERAYRLGVWLGDSGPCRTPHEGERKEATFPHTHTSVPRPHVVTSP